MVNFFENFQKKFFCTDPTGCSNCVSVFALTGRLLFCTDPAGRTNCRRRVRPDGAAPFLHRLSGAHELPQAGSSLTGGKFFAEPQQGFAVCGRRERAAPRGGDDAVPTAVGKKEGQPAVFLPL